MALPPERRAANDAFDAAEEEAKKVTNEDLQHVALALVYSVQGLMLQVRDADDTQADRLDTLIAAINENNTTMTASVDALAATLKTLSHEKKGLFS